MRQTLANFVGNTRNDAPSRIGQRERDKQQNERIQEFIAVHRALST